MSEWWIGHAAARATVDCGGRAHRLRWDRGRLRALDHDDPEGERALAALGGEPCPCVELLDAWERHAADPRVLVLGSRGPGDRLERSAGRHGWVSYAPLVSTVEPPDEEEEPLVRLLRLDGALADRLVATVAATWVGRLERADDDECRRALPRLHAALYGRATAALQAWTGRSALGVELEMIAAGAQPAVVRAGDGGVQAKLPFTWVRDVWARGLTTVMGRFCVAATTDDGVSWRLSAVGPDLGPLETIDLRLAR